jgi:hypothetical protein
LSLDGWDNLSCKIVSAGMVELLVAGKGTSGSFKLLVRAVERRRMTFSYGMKIATIAYIQGRVYVRICRMPIRSIE